MSDFTKPDWTLGYQHARMGFNENTPWPNLFPNVPSATDVQRSAYDSTQRPLDVAGPVTAAGETMRGRRVGAIDVPGLTDKSSSEVRTDMLRSGYVPGSQADRFFTNMHKVEVRDWSGMPKDQADAVFRATNVQRVKNFPSQSDDAYDGGNFISELDETANMLVEAIRNREYSRGTSLLNEEDGEDFDTKMERLVNIVVELQERFGGVSIDDIITSLHCAATNSGISLEGCLELAQQWSREGRTADVSEVVSALASKVSQGLHGTDKPKKPKSNDISNGTVAHAIAVASTGTTGIGGANKKRKQSTANAPGSKGIVGESVLSEARLAHFNRLMRG